MGPDQEMIAGRRYAPWAGACIVYLCVLIVVWLSPRFADAAETPAGRARDPSAVAAVEDLRGELQDAVRRAPADTYRRKELKHLLASPLDSNLSPQQIAEVMVDLADVGSLDERGKPTGVIREPVVVRVLAKELRSQSPRLRTLACQLLEQASDRQLSANAAEIRQALSVVDPAEAARLEARLLPDPTRVAELLRRTDLAPEVRARLGDSAARDAIIAGFGKATDFADKRALAEQLGYIGGIASARALASGLNSPLILKAPREEISIRYYILQALGHIYAEEPLLTSGLQEIVAVGDRVYGAQALKAYFSQLEAWIERDLGFGIRLDPQEVFYRRLLVKDRRPEPRG